MRSSPEQMQFDDEAAHANTTGEAIMNNVVSVETIEDGLSARALLSSIRRHLVVVSSPRSRYASRVPCTG